MDTWRLPPEPPSLCDSELAANGSSDKQELNISDDCLTNHQRRSGDRANAAYHVINQLFIDVTSLKGRRSTAEHDRRAAERSGGAERG